MSRSSAAFEAGLRPNDVIVSFNGQAVADPSQFSRLVADSRIGSTAAIKALRNGRAVEFKVPVVSTSTPRGRR
jgi:serine protease Do